MPDTSNLASHIRTLEPSLNDVDTSVYIFSDTMTIVGKQVIRTDLVANRPQGSGSFEIERPMSLDWTRFSLSHQASWLTMLEDQRRVPLK